MKTKKTTIYVIIALIGLLIIGYSVFKIATQNSFVYNGRSSQYKFTIEKAGSVIVYRPHVFINNQEYIYAFRNKPQQLEELKIEGDLGPILKRPALTTVYVTRDLNVSALTGDSASIAVAPLDAILNKIRESSIYKLEFRREFTEKSLDNPGKIPVDCDTANKSIIKHKLLVIYIRLAEENKIRIDDNCIIVEGKDADGMIKSAEKLGYYLLGVF